MSTVVVTSACMQETMCANRAYCSRVKTFPYIGSLVAVTLAIHQLPRASVLRNTTSSESCKLIGTLIRLNSFGIAILLPLDR